VNAVVKGPYHSRPHAQKTTPKATAMMEATTISTVRQRNVGEEPTLELLMRITLLTPCAGITQIRFEGLRPVAALSALVVLPCRVARDYTRAEPIACAV
jgi:hypothetical protein